MKREIRRKNKRTHVEMQKKKPSKERNRETKKLNRRNHTIKSKNSTK